MPCVTSAFFAFLSSLAAALPALRDRRFVPLGPSFGSVCWMTSAEVDFVRGLELVPGAVDVSVVKILLLAKNGSISAL